MQNAIAAEMIFQRRTKGRYNGLTNMQSLKDTGETVGVIGTNPP
jgi:hypothetical protein